MLLMDIPVNIIRVLPCKADLFCSEFNPVKVFGQIRHFLDGMQFLTWPRAFVTLKISATVLLCSIKKPFLFFTPWNDIMFAIPSQYSHTVPNADGSQALFITDIPVLVSRYKHFSTVLILQRNMVLQKICTVNWLSSRIQNGLSLPFTLLHMLG